jgi:hypothetical protein
MGLDIAGVTLKSGASKLVATCALQTLTMELKNSGLLVTTAHPMFEAGSALAGWTYQAAAGQVKIPFPVVAYNNGGHYDSVNSRFTAPVYGNYWFFANLHGVATVTNSDYCHPLFAINGSVTSWRPQPCYRIRHHGENNSGGGGTEFNTQLSETFTLNAGDYVEHHMYFSSTTIGYYGPYSGFAGVFLG